MILIGLVVFFWLRKVNSSQMSLRGCSKYGPLPAFCPLWSCKKCRFFQWVTSLWVWLLIELCRVHQRIGASVCPTPCWFSSLLVSFAHLQVLLPRSLHYLCTEADFGGEGGCKQPVHFNNLCWLVLSCWMSSIGFLITDFVVAYVAPPCASICLSWWLCHSWVTASEGKTAERGLLPF